MYISSRNHHILLSQYLWHLITPHRVLQVAITDHLTDIIASKKRCFLFYVEKRTREVKKKDKRSERGMTHVVVNFLNASTVRIELVIVQAKRSPCFPRISRPRIRIRWLFSSFLLLLFLPKTNVAHDVATWPHET